MLKMLETQRLVISEISLKDLEEARLLHNEPETLRWLSDSHVVSREEQIKWFDGLMRSSTSKRYIAREKYEGDLVGVFRFDRLDRHNSSAEVGLDISVKYRRLGFAKEIYETLIPYFFHEMSLHRLSLITLENNIPAIRLYQSLGFMREGVLREALRRESGFANAIQYSILEAEFKQ
jgi:[ribosomal protein S5]-alanine N-acetyltransferase